MDIIWFIQSHTISKRTFIKHRPWVTLEILYCPVFLWFSFCTVPGLLTPAVPVCVSTTNLPRYCVDSKYFLLSVYTMLMVLSRFPPYFWPKASDFSCSSISFNYTKDQTFHKPLLMQKGGYVILLVKGGSVYLLFLLNLLNIYHWLLKSHLSDFRGICCPIPSHLLSLLLPNYDFFAESAQQNVFNVTGCGWSCLSCFIYQQWHTRLIE